MLMKIKKCLTCKIAHEWDFDGPTLKELRQIKKITGLGGRDFGEAADSGDPEAMAALLWILHARSNIKIPFDDIDLDFRDFEMVETEEEKELREAFEAEESAGDQKKV